MHSNKLSGKIGFGFTVSVLCLFYQFSWIRQTLNLLNDEHNWGC